MYQEGNHQYRHSRLTQTNIISNEDADICVLPRFDGEAFTNNGVEACKLVPMKAQWNDIRIVVGIIKECRFLPDNEACLVSEKVEKEGKAIRES